MSCLRVQVYIIGLMFNKGIVSLQCPNYHFAYSHEFLSVRGGESYVIPLRQAFGVDPLALVAMGSDIIAGSAISVARTRKHLQHIGLH